MAEQHYNFRPTLLVGLGGIGSQIATLVHDIVKKNNLMDQHRLAILGFDTDENDIGDLLNSSHMNNRHLIRTSPEQTVWNVLAQGDPEVEEWFVKPESLTTEIRQMWLHDGAGQIRMLSRLAFHEALKDATVQGDIRQAIEVLTGPSDKAGISIHEGKINVLLVGTLAGGTGSGMFLQTALHLHDELIARGAIPEIRGVFLLPDVLVNTGRIPSNQILNVRANGYAALRELHGMLLTATGRASRSVEFMYKKGARLSLDKLPFKSITLIDYENQKGGQLQGGLEAYLQTTAHIVHTLLFTPIGGSTASVGVNDIRTKLAAAAQGDVNYYAGIGLAAAIYPTEEILEFLSLSYALSILGQEWLELDRRFHEELRQYNQRRGGRMIGERPPERGVSYIRDLKQSAKENAFFADIDAAVYRKTEDRQGREFVERHFESYLDALEAWMESQFWASEKKLQEIKNAIEIPLEGDFSSLQDLQNEVHQSEARLRGWRSTLETGLQTLPSNLFRNLFMDSEEAGKDQWKEYYLQPYILHEKAHPVEVRYFLYSLLQLIEERQQNLNVEQTRDALNRVSRVFDDPNTDQIETAVYRLSQLQNKSRIAAWFKRTYPSFGREYRGYFNDTLRLLKRFSEERLKADLYVRLERHISALLKVIEGFFDELEHLYPRLEAEIDRNRTLHGTRRGQLGANIYVYADAASKDQLVDSLARSFQGSMAAAEVNNVLIEALYAQYKAEREVDKWSPAPQFHAEQLFREKVVKEFCRQELKDNHQAMYAFNAVEAIRRESRLKGQEEQPFLQSVVDSVALQAEVYLRTKPNTGTPVVFWAISPDNKEMLGAQVEALLTRKAGTDTLVEPDYPDDELLCFSTCVNLTPRDMIKLSPGNPEDIYGGSEPGIYHKAYREMINVMFDDEQNNSGRPSRHFTPHLDKDWHRPGNLPGFTPEEDEATEQRIFDVFVLGLAMDRFERRQTAGCPVTDFRDWIRRGKSDEWRRLTQSHDDLEVLEAIRKDSIVTSSTLECAAEWREKHLLEDGLSQSADPEKTAIFQGLIAPGTLFRAAGLCADQTNPHAADAASLAVERLYEVIREYVDREMSTRTANNRLGKLEGIIQKQINALSSLTEYQDLAGDIRNQINEITQGTFQRLLSHWQEDALKAH